MTMSIATTGLRANEARFLRSYDARGAELRAAEVERDRAHQDERRAEQRAEDAERRVERAERNQGRRVDRYA
jgi:hypothetical protein